MKAKRSIFTARCRPQHLSEAQSRRCSTRHPDGVAPSSATPVKPPPPPPPPPSDLFVLISFCAQPPGRQVKVYPHTTHHFPHMPPGGGTLIARGKGKPERLTQSAAITTSIAAERKSEPAFHTISRRPVFISPILPALPQTSAAPYTLSGCILLISVSGKVYVY